MIDARAAAFAAAVTACACVATAAPARELPPDRAAAIDAFVQTFVDYAMFDGNIMIDIGGETVYARSFGFANYEHRIPNTLETKFRIASVSKQITDVALAKMIEAGTLDLSSRVSQFLPEFPRGDEITLQMLIEHTSGIPHTNDFDWGDGTISLTLDEIIERLAAEPLTFEPGSDAAYSNGGYTVLAKVLEIASGKSYDDVLRDALFRPLGMSSSGHISDSRAVIPGIATGYEPGEHVGERRHTRFYAVEIRPGGGSLYSSAPDLMAFGRAVCRDEFVSEESLADVLGMKDGVFLAQGRSPGFVAKLYCDRSHDVIVVSTSNSYSVPSHWGEGIAKLATGEADTWPWPIRLPPRSRERPPDVFLGTWRYAERPLVNTHVRGPGGDIVKIEAYAKSRHAMPYLEGGKLLHTGYWQICELVDDDTMQCDTIAGEPMYDTTLERTEE